MPPRAPRLKLPGKILVIGPDKSVQIWSDDIPPMTTSRWRIQEMRTRDFYDWFRPQNP